MERENLNGMFVGVKESVNVFTLSKRFRCKSAEKATVKITALGLYMAEINGVRVGDAYLTPGWTSYSKMLQVQSYDISGLLCEGENKIELTVAEGWYCGRISTDGTNTYGEKCAVCADLTIDGETVSTDLSWTARENYIRFSGFYDGEIRDFTAELKQLTPVEVGFDKSALVKQIDEPVRNIERLGVKEILHTPSGSLVYDFGQNVAGVVELKLPDGFCGTVVCEFGEITVGGELYNDNYRSAKSIARYTVCGQRTVCPEFTYHGFRYMKLTGAELPAGDVTAIVRHTDLSRTGKLDTSDERFNRLIENVVWGQRDNFVDIPSDCPQRDERLGWTGDINAFCRTAAYNYDIRLFMKKWLADLRNDMSENGSIPKVVPNPWKESFMAGAMWSDAVTMVPWTLYEMYGDVSFLSDNYGAMKKFIDARERNTVDGLTAKGFEYVDWLALDREQLMTDSLTGRTDAYFISSVFYAHSLDITAKTAGILGDIEEQKRFSLRREKLLKAMRKEYFTVSGRLALDTVTAQTLALHFGIVEEKFRAKLAKALNDNVIKHGCRVCTGFIGTPYLLFALADNGYAQTAHKVLLNEKYPGWLYEVDMGATTVWERWNSLLPDGTPNPEGMNSYNHYAYGSVMEFVYRRIAGIEQTQAGFKAIRLAPTPVEGLDAVRGEYDSVHGKIVSGYRREKNKIIYFAHVPQGVAAELRLPGEKEIELSAGDFTFER